MAWDTKLPVAAQLPGGLSGMVNHENRLLSEPTELLTAEGVAFDDLHIRKEPGTTAYDTTGLASAPTYSGTKGGPGFFGIHLAAFAGTGTIATGGTSISDTPSAVIGSRVEVVPASGYALGSLVVVTAVGVTAGVQATSVTDNKGNTWTSVGAITYDSSPTGPTGSNNTFYSILTTALVSGDSIQIFVNGTGTFGFIVTNFTGVTSLERKTSNTGQVPGTFIMTAGPLSATQTIPILLVASIGSNIATAVSPNLGYTERAEVTGSGMEAALHYRIDTALDNIVALYDWYSDVETTPAGTVSTTQGSKTVTGVGTTFTAHAPGDRIVISNETRVIETISSTTSLTTVTEWVTTNAGATYKIRVGNRIITASDGGKLYKEKPLTLTTGDLDATTLKSGLSLSARPGRFVAGGKEAAANNRKLFYFNGVDPVQVLSGDGTTTSNVATPPADWSATADENKEPINGTLHANRLVAWGNLNDPHRLYFSDVDNHENFTSAAAFNIRVRSEIGDRILCGTSFQGVLFIWKYPRGVFYLDDTELDPTNWSIRTKSEAVGCAPSPYAALPLDDDVLFLAADGTFHLLSAVSELGGTRASDLTRRLGLSKWIRENVNLQRLNQAVSVWDQQKKLAIFYVPSSQTVFGDAVPLLSEVNDLALKFDFSGLERDLPLKFSYSFRDIGDAVAVRRAPQGGAETLIIGSAGFVYLLGQEDRNANGVAYTGQYQIPHLDFSHLDPALRWRRKLFEHLELIMEPVDAGTLTVEVYVDGTLRQTLSYDATLRRQRKKLNVGDGFTFSIRVTNSALDEDFKVLSHLVWFKVGNEDQSRAA